MHRAFFTCVILALTPLVQAAVITPAPLDNSVSAVMVDGRFSVRATTNINAADSTNADQLWSGGGLGLNLSGAGVTVGVWDGGAVRSTHQEFGGRVTVVDAVTAADHGTHVAGTIGAAGVTASAKGMAPLVQIRSRDWNSDFTEMASDASLLNVSNHSYSYLTGWTGGTTTTSRGARYMWWGDYSASAVEADGFGNYSSDTRQLDQVLYNNRNLLSCWSAGNTRGGALPGGQTEYVAFFSTPPASYLAAGPYTGSYIVSTSLYPAPPANGNGGTGYDALSYDGQTAKNALVVGAMSDYTTDPHNGAAMTMTSFSSFGPTDDGRIAPHVVGNGVSLFSSLSTSNTAYGSMSGTSMSTPNVAGTAALLVEHHKNLKSGAAPSSAMQKAYLIHTATDVTASPGTVGPDYSTGFGMVNGAEAAQFLTNAASNSSTATDHMAEGTLANGAQTTWDGLVATGGSITATLVWTDPAGNAQSAIDDRTRVLVNDLDLWITDQYGATFYPWTLDVENPANAAVRTTANHLDNMEQVVIDSSFVGEGFTIHLGHTGSLTGGSQDYALVFSGVQVPEPTSMLLILPAALLALRRRARQ